jgi:hypothetical protein
MSEVARLIVGMGLDPRDFNKGLADATSAASGLGDKVARAVGGTAGVGNAFAGIAENARAAGENIASKLGRALGQAEGNARSTKAALDGLDTPLLEGAAAAQSFSRTMSQDVVRGAAAARTAAQSISNGFREGAIARSSETIRVAIDRTILKVEEMATKVDQSSKKSVAAFTALADSARVKLQQFGASAEQMRGLDEAIGSVSTRLRQLDQPAAAIGKVTRNTTAAAKSVGFLSGAFSQFTGRGQRAASAAVAVGFGLEGLARGGDAAETGLRQALRAVSSLAAAFGTGGLIVAGVAASAAAILDLFSRTRDELKKTTKTFTDEINQLVKDVDVVGLQKKMQEVWRGDPTAGEEFGGAFRTGLGKLEADLKVAEQKFRAIEEAEKGLLFKSADFAEARNAVQSLLDKVNPLREAYNAAGKAAREIQGAPIEPQGLKRLTVTIGTAKQGLEALTERARTYIAAEEQIGASKGLLNLPQLPARIAALYDTVKAQLDATEDKQSAVAVGLRTILADLDKTRAMMARSWRNPFVDILEFQPAQLADAITREVRSAAKFLTVPARIAILPLGQADLRDVRDQMKKVTDARGLAELAKLTGDNAFVKDTQEKLKAAEKAFKDYAGKVASDLAKSGTATDQQRDAIRELLDAVKELGLDTPTKTFRQHMEGIADTVLEITGAARGLSQVARAMGAIGDAAAKSVDAVVDLVGGIAQLTKGLASGDLSSIISGSIATLGSLFQLAGIGESEAQKEAKQIQKENNARLRELAHELEGFSSSLGNISRVAKAVSDIRIQTLADNARGERGTFGDAELERLHKALAAAGLSYADVARVAEDMGIKLRDSAGNLIGGAFASLAKALELQVKLLTQFGDSLDEQRRRTELRNEVFDVDDTPLQRFNDALSLLATQSDALRAAFGDIDVSTVSGRAAAEAILRDFVKRLEAGSISAAEFEKFGGKDEFIEWLITADDALDDFNDATRAATKGLLNVPDGIKLAAFQFNAMAARTIAELAPPVQPVPAAPPPTPGTPTAPGATGPSILFQFAEGSVVVTADGGDPKTIARGVISELMAEARAQFGDGSQWSRVVLN